MKKFVIILFIAYLSQVSVHASENCDVKSGYDLYTCRISQMCETPYASTEVYDTDEYEKASTYLSTLDTQENAAYAVLEEVKSQYRRNIGNIYSCSMIQAQENSLELVENELLSFQKTGELKGIMKSRINIRKEKLNIAKKKLSCTTGSKDVYNKQNVLGQTTLEACKYINYLEYLKGYYSNVPNVVGLNLDDTTDKDKNGIIDVKEDKDKDGVVDIDKVIAQYSTSEIGRLIVNIDATITDEIQHTYKVFPIAYQAYIEYENNYPLHFILEVIREDFVILRKKLHQSLMPIAQVGYKIINAMLK